MKVCIIGGGSTYTPELIEGLIGLDKEETIDEIRLLDIEKSRRKFSILSEFARRMLGASETEIERIVTFDPEVAISGADFVLNQFRPGLMEGRINDEKIPLEYGLIGQETTGIGGMACGIRAFPLIEHYVDMIRRRSNNAWIINFTNPSGMLTEFIVNYLDYERCLGLCNCPVGFQTQIAAAFGCRREDVFLRYYGLNHLSWIDRFSAAGVDKTDEVLDLVALHMENIPDIDYAPEFLAGFRLLPNPYLKYYYNTRSLLKKELEERDSTGTRGEVILGIEEKLLDLYGEADRIEAPEELSQRGGYMYSTVATELIRSLATGDGKTHIVNTPNQGAVSDFPDDYVMEIPAVVDGKGPKPVELGSVNRATVGLIHTVKNFERLTIEGYLNSDPDLVKQAMLIHPLGPDESQLEAVWSHLKKANAGYFTRFD
ncbi:MAG: 6-phospho-beta-glucosidase [Proteobacteria bacterium]|nr:6-phospho-beta-glucosidase [Pseudomonadota bacterium]